MTVAACSRAGIGYTDVEVRRSQATLRLAHGPGSDTLSSPMALPDAAVAACSRAGIGYTTTRVFALPRVAACSRAGIGYTYASHTRCTTMRCGLLTGRDRIHLIATQNMLAHAQLRLAHGPGSDTLRTSEHTASGWVAACSRAGIGYTSGCVACVDRVRCGLLTGRDRIH